ncbi:MAG: NADH-quinone oxidoreductase subunit C [Candidatus Eremiobacteraeota bacterium]|nr:NADH-quinone oxidoreductase subunit C [Candidatus Eremiobacteraeota bacterium]
MPSSQAPPAGATALDPTAVRPEIADARIIRVTPAELHATLEELKREGFTMLLDVAGADYPGREPRFDVVYHLLKLPLRKASIGDVGQPERVRVLCGVPENAPTVPTAVAMWPAADWAEREVFDLYGIVFEGHPDLRRIQMPDDWEGHPLRKDYPLRGVARERTPRPSFALKSNVAAGTPASGRTAAGLQKQIAQARERANNEKKDEQP